MTLLNYNKGIKAFLGLLLLLIFTSPIQAQKTKSQLEKEKKENLKKIKEASKILEQTKLNSVLQSPGIVPTFSTKMSQKPAAKKAHLD